MNIETAKRILLLYRAGTSYVDDPEFAEALELARQEGELRQWLAEQATVREIIQVRFKQVQIPEGFKEQIISERPWKSLVVSRQEIFALAAFVGVALLLGFVLLWSRPHPVENKLLAFESRMINSALRNPDYGMNLITNDLNQIRAYLAEHHAHADYTLPVGLDKATPIGCLIVSWQGNSVTMLCFKTGRPLSPGANSDLWLFIMDQKALSNPPGNSPEIAKVNRTTAATWTQDEKVYVLAVDGDQELLQNYL